MRELLIALAAVVMMAMPAWADEIGVVDIDIPEGWELAKEDVNEEDGNYTNYYYADGEIITIIVMDTSFLTDDTKILGNLYTFSCERLFGNYEGFMLMYDNQAKKEDLSKIFQECVYFNDNEWHHAVVGSGALNGYVLTIVYYAPSFSQNLHILECGAMINKYILK